MIIGVYSNNYCEDDCVCCEPDTVKLVAKYETYDELLCQICNYAADCNKSLLHTRIDPDKLFCSDNLLNYTMVKDFVNCYEERQNNIPRSMSYLFLMRFETDEGKQAVQKVIATEDNLPHCMINCLELLDKYFAPECNAKQLLSVEKDVIPLCTKDTVVQRYKSLCTEHLRRQSSINNLITLLTERSESTRFMDRWYRNRDPPHPANALKDSDIELVRQVKNIQDSFP